MTKGIKKGSKPEIKTKGLGKDLLKIVGVGLSAGVLLIAATDKIMKKATSSKEKEQE